MKKNIIEVTLNKKEDYINKFHNKRISPKLSEYILSECRTFKPRDKFEIYISHSFVMTKQEQNELVDMIRENYGVDIHEIKVLSEKRIAFDLVSILIGIVFLFFSVLVKNIPVVSEVFVIFGWVPIWEAMYSILFGGVKNRLLLKRLKRLTNCKIKFIQNEK